MIVKFNDKEYDFFYHKGDEAWMCKDSISLTPKFEFYLEIQLRDFLNKEFKEELLPDFLYFLEQNLANELDIKSQQILKSFNKIIDSEYLNMTEKFRFELSTIYYKEPKKSFNTFYNQIGFNYSLCYQLFHINHNECYAPYTFYFVDFLNTSLLGCRVELPY